MSTTLPQHAVVVGQIIDYRTRKANRKMECHTQKRNKAISTQLQTNKAALSTRLLANLPSHGDETSARGSSITLYFKGFRVGSSMLYRCST